MHREQRITISGSFCVDFTIRSSCLCISSPLWYSFTRNKSVVLTHYLINIWDSVYLQFSYCRLLLFITPSSSISSLLPESWLLLLSVVKLLQLASFVSILSSLLSVFYKTVFSSFSISITQSSVSVSHAASNWSKLIWRANIGGFSVKVVLCVSGEAETVVACIGMGLPSMATDVSVINFRRLSFNFISIYFYIVYYLNSLSHLSRDKDHHIVNTARYF